VPVRVVAARLLQEQVHAGGFVVVPVLRVATAVLVEREDMAGAVAVDQRDRGRVAEQTGQTETRTAAAVPSLGNVDADNDQPGPTYELDVSMLL